MFLLWISVLFIAKWFLVSNLFKEMHFMCVSWSHSYYLVTNIFINIIIIIIITSNLLRAAKVNHLGESEARFSRS